MAEAPILNSNTTAGIETSVASDPDSGAILGLTVKFKLTGGGSSDVFFVPLQGIPTVLRALQSAAGNVLELHQQRN